MDLVNEHDLEFRHGDHGPKYLFRGPRFEWGVIVLRPGDELGIHKHQQVEETFYFETGAPQIILDTGPRRVRSGDVFQLQPGEVHNIINDANEPTRIIFIKCPFLPDDKVTIA